jgi:hypothetical protein
MPNINVTRLAGSRKALVAFVVPPIPLLPPGMSKNPEFVKWRDDLEEWRRTLQSILVQQLTTLQKEP